MVAQFTLFQHLMAPGKRPVRELATLPIVSGIIFGFTIGMIRVISHPQVIHKPALAKVKEKTV